MSDNYHQAVNGGTGANHIMLGTGDAIWFSDGNGHPQTPPNNPVNPAAPGTPVTGGQRAERNRKPKPTAGHQQLVHSGRLWRRFRLAAAATPNGNYGGGSYVNCAGQSQPGVAADRGLSRRPAESR